MCSVSQFSCFLKEVQSFFFFLSQYTQFCSFFKFLNMYLGTAFVELHRDKLYSVEFDMYLRFSDLQQLETLCSVTLRVC